MLLRFLMPTAKELGLVKDSGFQNMEIGQTLEINGKFEILPVDGERKWETAIVPTKNGKVSTTSKTVIGQLRSENPKSIGQIALQALNKKSTLTVFVVKNVNPENNNVGYKLSLFKPNN